MATAKPETEQERDLTQDDFFELVRLEGITIDGTYYKSSGHGKQTRYHAYDPGVVKGLDALREDGDVVAQEVSNHEEAFLEDVSKDELKDVYSRFRDGFGIRGAARVSEPPEDAGSDGGDDGPEPMSEEETHRLIEDNFEEHGFFAEDEDGEAKVVSLAHPDARLMGYITGSHVKALPNGMESVDDYRRTVAATLRGLPDGYDIEPGDVPIAPDALMERFEEWGQQTTESGFDFAHFNKQRWEDGHYDHLRAENGGDDE